jgi:hypothetical protein
VVLLQLRRNKTTTPAQLPREQKKIYYTQGNSQNLHRYAICYNAVGIGTIVPCLK